MKFLGGFRMSAISAPTSVLKSEFDLNSYLTTQKGEKAYFLRGRNKFDFKDQYIERLPFIEDNVIELTDGAVIPGCESARLILRIGKKTKTFYAVLDRNTRHSLGRWMPAPSNKHYPKGFLNVKKARELLQERVIEARGVKKQFRNIGNLTLLEYIDNHYRSDRDDTPTKSNSLSPVTDKTLLELRSAFSPWHTVKLSDFNENHPNEFREYWSNKEQPIPTETMRKCYSLLNSMFNICVKKQYLSKNKIDGKIYLFPRNPHKKIVTYEYKTNDVLSFLFNKDTPGNNAAKIIVATMILTGARNSEVYKNKKCNFNSSKKIFHIPLDISKNNFARNIPIESNIYWEFVEEYLRNDFLENASGFMFPVRRVARSPHVTSSVYRETWKTIKSEFDIPKEGRLYDNRSTFAKNALKTIPIEDVAKLTGHALETLFRYYVDKNVSEGTRQDLKKFQSASTIDFNEDIKLTDAPASIVPYMQHFIDSKNRKNVTPTMADFIEIMKDLNEKNKLTGLEMMWLDGYIL